VQVYATLLAIRPVGEFNVGWISKATPRRWGEC